MIRLAPLEILRPDTLEEASGLLDQHRSGITILAGGTDLVVNLKQGLYAPKKLVWLGNIGRLKEISFSEECGLRIGSACTLTDLSSSLSVQRNDPALVEAVRSIASPAIRNRATLGGNLCLEPRCQYYDQSEFWRGAIGGCLKLAISGGGNGEICHAAPGLRICSAVFCSDTAPILIAQDASVVLLNRRGGRTIPLAQLYTGDGIHHLSLYEDEMIVEVLIPVQSSTRQSIFKKLSSRQSIDFPLVNVGISLLRDRQDVCIDANIVVGGVGSAPKEMERAERLLQGFPLTDESIEKACEAVVSNLKPVPNVESSILHRKTLATTVVRRALTDLMTRRSPGL